MVKKRNKGEEYATETVIYVATKPQIVHYLALYRKTLPALALRADKAITEKKT